MVEVGSCWTFKLKISGLFCIIYLSLKEDDFCNEDSIKVVVEPSTLLDRHA